VQLSGDEFVNEFISVEMNLWMNSSQWR